MNTNFKQLETGSWVYVTKEQVEAKLDTRLSTQDFLHTRTEVDKKASLGGIRAIYPLIEVNHSDRLTENYTLFPLASYSAGHTTETPRGYRSMVLPNGKPILYDHNLSQDQVQGRIVVSSVVPNKKILTPRREKGYPGTYEGTAAMQVIAQITNSKCIDDILTSAALTVSFGARAYKVIESTSGEDLLKLMEEGKPTPSRYKGSYYNNELSYFMLSEWAGFEASFVPRPADTDARKLINDVGEEAVKKMLSAKLLIAEKVVGHDQWKFYDYESKELVSIFDDTYAVDPTFTFIDSVELPRYTTFDNPLKTNMTADYSINYFLSNLENKENLSSPEFVHWAGKLSPQPFNTSVSEAFEKFKERQALLEAATVVFGDLNENAEKLAKLAFVEKTGFKEEVWNIGTMLGIECNKEAPITKEDLNALPKELTIRCGEGDKEIVWPMRNKEDLIALNEAINYDSELAKKLGFQTQEGLKGVSVPANILHNGFVTTSYTNGVEDVLYKSEYTTVVEWGKSTTFNNKVEGDLVEPKPVLESQNNTDINLALLVGVCKKFNITKEEADAIGSKYSVLSNKALTELLSEIKKEEVTEIVESNLSEVNETPALVNTDEENLNTRYSVQLALIKKKK